MAPAFEKMKHTRKGNQSRFQLVDKEVRYRRSETWAGMFVRDANHSCSYHEGVESVFKKERLPHLPSAGDAIAASLLRKKVVVHKGYT
jgi:hypothetical protein